MEKNHEILDSYLQGEPELTDGQYHHVKLAMDEYAHNLATEFAQWHHDLTPTQRCTVHAPAGSGSGTGLYLLDMDELFKKFLRIKFG